jgi:hypothetical protein
MLCDIDVPEAMFKIKVKSTVERIYENEIYPAGKVFEWERPFGLIWRNYQLANFADAREQVNLTLDDAANKIFTKIATGLGQWNFMLLTVEAVKEDDWKLLLKVAIGERKSQGIEVYEVPKFHF